MIDSTLMLTILPCEQVEPYDIIFFSYTFHIYPYFLLSEQVFKTSCLTAKRGKVQFLYILIYF